MIDSSIKNSKQIFLELTERQNDRKERIVGIACDNINELGNRIKTN